MSQNWGLSPFCDPSRFFFKNRALSLLYPYDALTKCKNLEKTNEWSLRYLMMDTRTDGHTRAHSGKPGVKNSKSSAFKFFSHFRSIFVPLYNKKCHNKTSTQLTLRNQIYLSYKNKTSIQWTPGSHIYHRKRTR